MLKNIKSLFSTQYKIVLCLFLSFIAKFQAQEATPPGIQKFLSSPKNYGIVIDNAIGVIESANIKNDTLTFHYTYNSKSHILSGTYKNNHWKTYGTKKIKLQFNIDGTAKGKTANNEDAYILIGKKSTDSKVITNLSNRKLRSLSMNLVIKNKLPGHDAPVWFYFQSENYLQISFVFPKNFIHPSYGPQNRVRIFTYKKEHNKWQINEDNSSVHFKK